MAWGSSEPQRLSYQRMSLTCCYSDGGVDESVCPSATVAGLVDPVAVHSVHHWHDDLGLLIDLVHRLVPSSLELS